MTAAGNAIEARGLRKTFGAVDALAPLDLVVPRGSIFALVGANGAGKTTLFKLLLNMIPATSGEATVLGEASSGLKGSSFSRIGFVSESQEMPEWMTVRGYMDYLRPFYAEWDEGTLLEDLDLPPERAIKHLSRGMRMKTALASVLAFRPPLIVMDEPFSGLDPLVRDQLIETLLDRISEAEEMGGENGATILISSHDLAEIESFATHVGFLQDGKLLFAESMATLSARFREVTVTLGGDEAAPVLRDAPASWLMVESSASVVRFVHANAADEAIEDEVRAVLPRATLIEAAPMTLRTIFLALAKSSGRNSRGSERRRA